MGGGLEFEKFGAEGAGVEVEGAVRGRAEGEGGGEEVVVGLGSDGFGLGGWFGVLTGGGGCGNIATEGLVGGTRGLRKLWLLLTVWGL